ncbi:MAG TPA: hypothetical protein PLS53_12440 [Thermoanaerobaculaceae bacterium]|nr:hypothetical protein [Thermoanaerobaculaceae bacterium]
MSMKTTMVVVVALVGLVLVAPAALAIEGTLDLSAQSQYIWRGMILNDKPVFQPSINLSQGLLSASVWFNVDLTDDSGHRWEHNEVDYSVAYTSEFKHFDFTLTWYEYTFPHTTTVKTQELWASVALKTALSPTFTAVRDIDLIEGWYYTFSVAPSFELLDPSVSEGLTLTLSVGRGTGDYVRGYYPDVTVDTVTDYLARLDLPVKLGPGTLKLNLQYTNFTDADIRTPGFETESSGRLVGGIGYTLAF